MPNRNVMLITGTGMASVLNEAYKIQVAFHDKGVPCDIYFFNKDNPSKTRVPKYDLAIWWTPFLPMFISRQRGWLNISKENIAISYYVIEGKVRGVYRGDNNIRWQYIVTPSHFVKSCIEEMGFGVKDVIPHQILANPSIDHNYGVAWRNRFPKDKKVLLYNGSQILRKALPKLREAINILSAKRSDFVMVFHTDNINAPFHTKVSELQGANTVIETEFPHLPIAQAYAKMYYCDVVVHPAITEGFALPIGEALALGKTLVCINAYGVNEIATPQNSFMVMNVRPTTLKWSGYIDFKAVDYSPQDLATQIELALDSPFEVRHDKIARGLNDIKRFYSTYDRFTEFV